MHNCCLNHQIDQGTVIGRAKELAHRLTGWRFLGERYICPWSPKGRKATRPQGGETSWRKSCPLTLLLPPPHPFFVPLSTDTCVFWASIGAATGEVDLLPMPGPSANWTAGLSVHYSQDSSLIYWFNGTQAVQVPLGSTAGLGSGPQESLSDHFTLSFWMKHGATPSKKESKKEEETIVCNTVQNGEPSSECSF